MDERREHITQEHERPIEFSWTGRWAIYRCAAENAESGWGRPDAFARALARDRFIERAVAISRVVRDAQYAERSRRTT